MWITKFQLHPLIKAMLEIGWWAVFKFVTNFYAAETPLLLFSWIVHTPGMTRHEWNKTNRSVWWHLNLTFHFSSTVRAEKEDNLCQGNIFPPLPASHKIPWTLLRNINNAATDKFQQWTHLCAWSVKNNFNPCNRSISLFSTARSTAFILDIFCSTILQTIHPQSWNGLPPHFVVIAFCLSMSVFNHIDNNC